MAAVFARRADEFAALVEGTSTRGQQRHARLLELVGQLQATAAPAPRPAFVADLRERLMAEADLALAPVAAGESAATDRRPTLPGRSPAGTPRRTTRERRVAWGVGSLALLTGAATVAIGSQVALPGDTLYPVKRALEDASTSLAVGDGETGERMLAHATERLEETEALTRRARVDTDATESSLRDFTLQAQDGALLLTEAYADTRDPERIADLRDFTGDSMGRLVALEPQVPPEARDELVMAAEAVVAIDDDARNTCSYCGGAGVVDVPISLTAASFPAPSGDGLASAGGPDDPDAGGGGPGGPGGLVPSVPPIPTALPTDLPTLLPTVNPTGGPSGGPKPTPPAPSGPTKAPLPQPTLLPTALPTLLPTALPTLLPTQITTLLTPLDPVTSLASPLDPVTSLLPTLPLGVQGVVPDDLGAPSPTPLP